MLESESEEPVQRRRLLMNKRGTKEGSNEGNNVLGRKREERKGEKKVTR